MTKKYMQIVDYEGFTMKSGEILKLACCDCGLVHKIAFVVDKKTIGIAFMRDKRATAAKRRKRK